MAKKFDAKAKAKRQKIILAVLGVVFLGVLAWQVPSVLAIMNKKPATAAAPPPATPAPGAPVAPVAGTPVSAPGTPAPAGSLVDSDPVAQAAGGQLVTFDRFESKDPFQQQLDAEAKRSTPGGGAKPTKAPVSGEPSAPSAPQPSSAAPAPTSAQISVNGSKENVDVGATFPQADPMFVLVSMTRTTAKISISGGSLDTGGATVTLRKGKPLTLENTVDGARYTVVLVATR
jgi:hypothetical protein